MRSVHQKDLVFRKAIRSVLLTAFSGLIAILIFYIGWLARFFRFYDVLRGFIVHYLDGCYSFVRVVQSHLPFLRLGFYWVFSSTGFSDKAGNNPFLTLENMLSVL